MGCGPVPGPAMHLTFGVWCSGSVDDGCVSALRWPCRVTAAGLLDACFVDFFQGHMILPQDYEDSRSINPMALVGPSTEPQEEASPEQQAAWEAEKPEKKWKKKARQRAARAQAAAPHQRSQAEVGPDHDHLHMPTDGLTSTHKIYANAIQLSAFYNSAFRTIINALRLIGKPTTEVCFSALTSHQRQRSK